ncbi:hypothetical protein [Paraburkholderia sp. BCC1886]|uniref:hypothetical protein n=1 Tax=Paraburkholderia sp. BCC1886 TaxID=2562670 RepID=UPI0011837FDC|nr:hypothetical protein [Paraburkholderia sp. BCC1886]
MLYLKNTLGGLGRSLTDSAIGTFQGPHRWWKLALLAVLFVLPGGSVAIAVFAWFEHRRARKGALAAAQKKTAVALIASTPDKAVANFANANPSAPAGACQSRGAACRAAAGKQARQPGSTDSRI